MRLPQYKKEYMSGADLDELAGVVMRSRKLASRSPERFVEFPEVGISSKTWLFIGASPAKCYEWVKPLAESKYQVYIQPASRGAFMGRISFRKEEIVK